jgi:hypothetical protein
MTPEQLKGSPLPKTGSPQERADWYRANASPEERLAIAAHELGHYEMDKRAGVDAEGITIGHHPMDSRSASRKYGSGDIDTGLTHSIDQWRLKGSSLTDSGEKERFLISRLKSLYAGEIAEELINGKATNSGREDSKHARDLMWTYALCGNVILSEDQMDHDEIKLKQQVKNELNEPETKQRLTHAAQQLAEHHFDGQKHPASTLDHYLDGGIHQDLPIGRGNDK